MTNRAHAPSGAPCWADLWTSDVEGARRFYCELFGWEAQEPSPDYGGYFMFTRQGVPVAGAMGDMGERRADDTWKPFLATDDLDRTLKVAGGHGATVHAPAMAVEDLGIQAVIGDPSGAVIGVWQPGSFPGFTVINEPGRCCSSPSTSTIAEPRSPSTAMSSDGSLLRRKSTATTTPGSWTPRPGDRWRASATRWRTWNQARSPAGESSGSAVTLRLRWPGSARSGGP